MMSSLSLLTAQGQLLLKGDLTRDHISQVKVDEGLKFIKSGISTVDLSDILHVDTAGLAYLLLLLQEANKQNLSLNFIHIPLELEKLAKLSSVDSFLSVA